MREVEKRVRVGRRLFLRGAATAVPATALAASGLGVSAAAAWAQEAKALKPHAMATLVRMSRDIYPHDHIPDAFYVSACRSFDDAAGAKPEAKEMFHAGVDRLDADARDRFKVAYLDVPEETDRVALLRGVETTPFFNKLRSGLVVSFYNQPEMWHRFGYEGSSSEYGGYINRGFNDADWLPKV